MIKVGILGAETMAAGELVRILINHPDVEILRIASATEAGRKVADLHRGLVGDTDMEIVSELSPEGLDAVFLCGEPWQASRWMNLYDAAAREIGLKIIDLTGAFRGGEHDMVYGFAEHNRKALVRGATRASVPSALALAVETALFPMAKNCMLPPERIRVNISMAEIPMLATTRPNGAPIKASAPFSPTATDYTRSTRLDPIAPREHRPDAEDAATEAAAELRRIQPSFAAPIEISLSRDNASQRGMVATIEVAAGMSLSELRKIYDNAYEDHGFAYPVDFVPTVADVANTNKCLINLSYPTSELNASLPALRIVTACDNLLRGAAGNGVHLLNLLFGLSERTGLALKASAL